MGIITVLLFANGYLQGDFHVPFWVVISCQVAMGLGTLIWWLAHCAHHGHGHYANSAIGWFLCTDIWFYCLIFSHQLGIPVSTTHTITGAIVGVGMSRRVSAVRWGLASRIVWAWVLTIPCAGLMAASILEPLGKLYAINSVKCHLLKGLCSQTLFYFCSIAIVKFVINLSHSTSHNIHPS